LRWLHGVRLPDRVYGPNLMLKTCLRAAEDGLPIFLFGGTAEMIEKLVKNLTDRFPSLQIAGTQPSRFRQFAPDERQAAVDTIRNSGAAITFVGLGCPRQEVWAYEFREALSMPVLAVGAAFAFHAGLLSQAPEFMQRRGLEWAYRLFKEPLRLWKRYLFLNPLYLWLILLQRTKLRGFDPGNTTRPVKELMYG
jgi:exopolysaccharide biosynthesis WecB/TagA/CpsF family protein